MGFYGWGYVHGAMITAITLTPLQLLLAWYSVRYEIYVAMAITTFLFGVSTGFVLLMTYVMYQVLVISEDEPKKLRMEVYAYIVLPLLLGTTVVAGMCTTNFNKGLKPHLQTMGMTSSWETRRQSEESCTNGQQGSQRLNILPSRMEIE